MRRAIRGPAAFQRLLSSRGVIRRELTISDSKDEQQLRESGMFCHSCFTFSKDLLSLSIPGGQVTGLPDDLGEPCEEAITCDISLQQLDDAAEKGCHLCAFVATRVFDNRHGHYMGFAALAEEGPGLMGCCARADTSEASERVRDSVAFLRRFLEKYPDAEFTAVGIPLGRDPVTAAYSKLWLCVRSSNVDEDANRILVKMRGPPEITLELYAIEDTAAASWIHSRPIQTKPGSDENIETVKSWISECRENHPSCGQRSEKPCKLPTRLVRILGDDRAELYHPTENEIGQYVALSYLWGDPELHEWKSSATLVANLAERNEEFDRGSLPKAIRDASSMTEALGMEYIWIDRLCIIQDSKDDKDRELRRMSQYYQNAYLTLTASTNSAAEGFIEDTIGCSQHPDFPAHRDLLRILVMCPDKRLSVVFFRQETPHNLAVEPITGRGWTFEERLLSLRYLMHGKWSRF
ncbi:hypothetical protein FJTKL_05927 [Diaporthe vaccinii]|uniref:Heterokaryon incompatibility domain-containing protein n=1 Tax=Diaporthe vaccinii TaxID=105482 RepID=A0ABR4DSG1_9PEZI